MRTLLLLTLALAMNAGCFVATTVETYQWSIQAPPTVLK